MASAILVVDDNPSVRQVLRRSLEQEADLQVCGEARNGEDAIRQVEALRPDLVVVDFSMPVLNGLDVTKALRRLRPTMPIVLFTMFKDRRLEEEAFAAGANLVVSKAAGIEALADSAHLLLRHPAGFSRAD